jgi:hypothetical protein
MTLQVVSCGCTVESVAPQLALQFAPAGIWRVPGQIDADLLGYYPLGEYHGNDISGKGNHATRIGLDEPSELVRGILCEDAEVMDGRQYFVLPFELSRSITVSIWCKPTSPKLETTILSVGDDLRFGLSWMLEPIIWINERKPDEDVINASPLVRDKWTHITFVRRDAEYLIYVNGLPVQLFHDGRKVKHAITTTEPLSGIASLSRYRDASGLYGAYQEVAIRAASLSASEIKHEYRSYCEALLEVN